MPTPALDRDAHTYRRVGSQISRGRTEHNVSSQTTLQPGNGWTLAMLGGESSQLITNDWSGDVLGSDEFNKASNWATINTWRSPGTGGSALTGMGADASVIGSGIPAFIKRVAAGTTWANTLTADITAVPQPTLYNALIPMDRVLSGKTTWPANCGFALSFTIQEGMTLPDTVCTFYFGGAAVTSPSGRTGGRFCLIVRGNGRAELREFTAASPDPWTPRHEFQWRHNEGGGNISHHTVKIMPYGRDTIAFRTLDMDGVISDPGFSAGGLVAGLVGHMIGAKTTKKDASFYRNHATLTGYIGVNAITGPGTIRLDVRRDLRAMFKITRLRPPASGTLTDLPFPIPYPLAAGEPILVTGDTFLPAGTEVTVSLFSAVNDAACTPLGGNRFEAFAGVQAYYPKFTFTADSKREQTPVLWSYSINTPASSQDRSPTPTYGGNIRDVSISGPDLTPDMETASVQIADPTNALETPLRTRGRIPSRIAVYNDLGALTTILFQGEVAKATAVKKGKTGMVYPSAAWRNYDVQMVGMWARLQEFLNLSVLDYNRDPDAVTGADGLQPAWKITSIIRHLLYRAGFPADMVAIPDLGLRFQSADPSTSRDAVLQPATSIAEAINKFARDYLGMSLVFDPNAGTRGMWRLLGFPQTPYTTLANFIGGPLVANRLAVHPNSYETSYAPILGDSFRSFVRAPECNYVWVAGMEPVIPSLVYAAMYNPVSFDFTGPTSDASHPDYLGRIVKVVHVDPLITTAATAAVVCRRIYDRAAHAEKVLQWLAPLILVTDPNDAYQVRVRPLRIYDVVTVHGATAAIRSVNASYKSDGIQLANYEAIAL